MKRMILCGLLAMLAGAVTLFAQNTDNGHQLVTLWKEYEKANKADLPKKEAEILANIKSQAMAQHLPVDFYDAATAYVNTVQRRNWKERESLREALAREVKEFDEPIVTFLWMAQWAYASHADLEAYVQAHPEGFQGCHRALHRGVEGYLNGSLAPFIRNDREYALWYLFSDSLKAEVAGIYPNEAAREYIALTRRSFPNDEKQQAETAAWQVLADKYAHVPFGVYPKGELLRLRFDRLVRERADASAFRALYEDAQALEKERKGYSGDAKTLVKGCNYPSGLMATLTDKDLWVDAEKGEATVRLRNLSQATLTLKQEKKTLQTWQVQNPIGSFYVVDTVKIVLPELPDGEYMLELKNGKLTAEESYIQYHLSIATRTDSRGYCVYVTDYDSGKPLSSVKLILNKSGKEVASATLKLNGFTPLPQAFAQHLGNSSATWELVAEDGTRKSQPVYVNRSFQASKAENHVRCNIYKDRGAYHPGDTVQFKVIVFDGDPARSLTVVKNRKLTLTLRDPESNKVETKELTTNAWGSVSASFAIPEGHRNGYWNLVVNGLGQDSFRVDEFVLPSFDLVFDPVEELYLTGAQVPLSGRLVSYSGHNLAGARVAVTVSRYGEAVLEKELPMGPDNRFETSFEARESGYYRAEVTVTDAGGETSAYGRSWYIGDELRVIAQVKNAADAQLVSTLENGSWRQRNPQFVVTEGSAQVLLQAQDNGGNSVPLPVQYTLTTPEGKVLAQGETPSGESVSLALPGSGLYLLKAQTSARKADGNYVTGEVTARIFCLPAQDKALPKEVKHVFVPGTETIEAGAGITARLGTGEGDAWTVVTLYGKDRKVLENKTLQVRGGSLETLTLSYKEEYPDAVYLQVFYFIHGQAVNYGQMYRRAQEKYTMPLQFTRFQDKAYPGTKYSFSVKTQPGAEVLVAAWDKSIDAIETNDWPLVHRRDFSVETVGISSACGRVGGGYSHILYRGIGAPLAKSAGINTMAVYDTAAESEEAMMDVAAEQPAIREDFAPSLTFQPHLRPSADGKLNFSFKTSDKLSTFYVRVYAHDAAMHNALIQNEMLVSLPVKVSLLEPRYLYVGDVYNAAVTVSSVADEDVRGTLSLQVGDAVQQVSVTVPAGQTVTHYFPVIVTQEKGNALPSSCVITASFRAKEFSDAVRMKVPVYAAAQQLTEAHSAVLRAGMDREALLADLRGRFVNVPASQATLREISILDMVNEVIPEHVEPSGTDVLSLSEAWYVQQSAELLERILLCRNADGGFAWFEGMRSSPVITAVLLERFAKLRDRGVEVPDLTTSVQYLDKHFTRQFALVRSMYSEVPFKEKVEKLKFDTKGRVLEKARYLLTLKNLAEREGGLALAKAWGVKPRTSAKIRKTIQAETASLLEYAVEHRDGGWYYPNAVMPWRGLLESEAYAHTLICELLAEASPTVADGIRLWLMLQKETQQWDTSPAFVDAVTAILEGSEDLLNTKVLVLSASYEVPFDQIQASGNGFTLERAFYRNGEEIQPGDSVKVGDKITVKYRIWNAENRSFVKLTAGREASLSPVQQLSGLVSYNAYRNVKAAATEYYYESYPEEKTTVTEEFFVVRAGSFQAPVAVIESLYAPHYRANSAYRPPLGSLNQ